MSLLRSPSGRRQQQGPLCEGGKCKGRREGELLRPPGMRLFVAYQTLPEITTVDITCKANGQGVCHDGPPGGAKTGTERPPDACLV